MSCTHLLPLTFKKWTISPSRSSRWLAAAAMFNPGGSTVAVSIPWWSSGTFWDFFFKGSERQDRNTSRLRTSELPACGHVVISHIYVLLTNFFSKRYVCIPFPGSACWRRSCWNSDLFQLSPGCICSLLWCWLTSFLGSISYGHMENHNIP